MSGEDISLHWGAALPVVVSLLLIVGSPVFATQEFGIGDVYTDDGYVVYFDPSDGAFCFLPPTSLELEDTDTANAIWSERKLFMPYNLYNL